METVTYLIYWGTITHIYIVNTLLPTIMEVKNCSIAKERSASWILHWPVIVGGRVQGKHKRIEKTI